MLASHARMVTHDFDRGCPPNSKQAGLNRRTGSQGFVLKVGTNRCNGCGNFPSMSATSSDGKAKRSETHTPVTVSKLPLATNRIQSGVPRNVCSIINHNGINTIKTRINGFCQSHKSGFQPCSDSPTTRHTPMSQVHIVVATSEQTNMPVMPVEGRIMMATPTNSTPSINICISNPGFVSGS